MNSKAIQETLIKSRRTHSQSTKSTFPKIKMDGFYHAVKNTNMLEVVEKIKNEKISRS